MTGRVPGVEDEPPFDCRRSRAQIAALLKLLGRRPQRVLDLGCGDGRVLVPLARAGHRVVGIDHQPQFLDRCRMSLARFKVNAELIHGDFTRNFPRRSRFDVVICLGNTFMTIAEMDDAIALTQAIATRLLRGGMFIIDDLPGDFWPELTAGNWQQGFNPDQSMQMVWRRSDAVFALRRGARIDRRNWRLTSDDVPHRLWCDGSLRLLAQVAGFSAPRRLTSAGLLVFKRKDSSQRRRRRVSR